MDIAKLMKEQEVRIAKQLAELRQRNAALLKEAETASFASRMMPLFKRGW